METEFATCLWSSTLDFHHSNLGIFFKNTQAPCQSCGFIWSEVGSDHPTQTLCFKVFTGNCNGQLGLRITAISHCDTRRQAGRSARGLIRRTILFSLRAVLLKAWSQDGSISIILQPVRNANSQFLPRPRESETLWVRSSPPGESDACLGTTTIEKYVELKMTMLSMS